MRAALEREQALTQERSQGAPRLWAALERAVAHHAIDQLRVIDEYAGAGSHVEARDVAALPEPAEETERVVDEEGQVPEPGQPGRTGERCEGRRGIGHAGKLSRSLGAPLARDLTESCILQRACKN